MSFIKAFNGYLVKPEYAETVVSPAYDSVSPQQRRQFADANPDNFINTMRLQEDYADDERPTKDELLSGNRQRLQTLLANGSYLEVTEPGMFIYQLGTSNHLQTGLVCEVAVDEYKSGRLLKHENTRHSKEDLLTQYQSVVGAVSSPICLTYARNPAIDTCITRLMHSTPDLDFTTNEGEVQRVWRIRDAQALQNLQQLFENIGTAYITDGHHRAAAGLRYSESMQAKEPALANYSPCHRLLVVFFPDNQLNLLPFHRSVKDTNNLSVQQLLNALSERFDITGVGKDEVYEPAEHGEFGMLVEDQWYQLQRKPFQTLNTSPVESLDVTILQQDILDPILGIKNMRDDSRLGYIAGVAGEEGIIQANREGSAIIFTCFPTSIKQLMTVADANALMPPKSTYFDPKPRSGIFVRLK